MGWRRAGGAYAWSPKEKFATCVYVYLYIHTNDIGIYVYTQVLELLRSAQPWDTKDSCLAVITLGQTP